MTQNNSVEELLAELFTDEDSNELQSNNINTLNDYDFFNLFRMNKQTVHELQKEINENDTEFDTNLLLTLFILGNITPWYKLSNILKTPESTLISICKTYSDKVLQLSNKYVTWPTSSELVTLEQSFTLSYDFPTVVGAIGCLHISAAVPDNVPNISEYFNENTGNYTIVLQAVCDSSLLFRDLFIGFPGSYTVEELLQASPLYNTLTDNEGCLKKTNKHLLGGTEHPQLDTLLTPYPFSDNLNERQLKFNAKHSSAMLVIDRTFQMIENRFQRMKCMDDVDVKFATLALGAICVLHNFCRIRNDDVNN